MRQRLSEALAAIRLGTIRDLVFGYDLFICHDSEEAGDFAAKLKRLAEASTPPIRCFLDQTDFNVGDELRGAVVRRVRMSRYCAVIVTPGVGAPESWVPVELGVFTRGGTRKLDRIAPLNVDESLQRLPADSAVRGYLPFAEGPGGEKSVLFHPVSKQEFAAGPSEVTLQRLQSFLGSRRTDRFRLRFFQAATAVLLGLTVVAFASAFIANVLRGRAERARNEAIAALRTQSRMLVDNSSGLLERGDPLSSALLALEGLPDAASPDPVRRDWPYVPELERQLFRQVLAIREQALLPVPVPPAGPVLYNADSSRLLIGGHLHDGRTGKRIAVLMESGHEVPTIFFARHGEWVVFLKEGQAKIVRAVDGREVAGLLQRPDHVTMMALAPDASVALTAHEDGSLFLQHLGGEAVAIHTSVDEDRGRIGWETQMVFDPRSQHFVLTNGETAELWRVAGPARVARLPERQAVRGAVFDPSGESFLLLPETGEDTEAPIHLYATATGDLRQTFRESRGAVRAAAFSRDGQRLLTGSSDNQARLWNVETGELVARLAGHTTDVIGVDFVGRNGDRILTRGQGSSGLEADANTVRLWQADGTLINSLTYSNAWVSVMDLNPERTAAAISYADAGTVIWNLDTGQSLSVLSAHRSFIRETRYSPDGRRLVTMADDDTLRFWSAGRPDPWLARLVHPQTTRQLNDFGVVFPTVVREAAFNATGTMVATITEGDSEPQLFLWSIQGNQPALVQQTAMDPATVKVALREGLVARLAEERLTLRGLFDGSVRDAAPAGRGPLACVAFRGNVWSFAGADGTIVIRDSAQRTEISRFALPLPPPEEMALDASGRRLVTVGSDGVVRWWRAGSEDPVAHWQAGDSQPSRMVADESGRLVGLASAGGEVQVFDMDGSRLSSFRPRHGTNFLYYQEGGPAVMTFSKSGGRIAIGSGHSIEVRDTRTGSLERSLTGHEKTVSDYRDFAAIEYTSEGKVLDLTFTSDERRLISAANDGTAKIWDLTTGEVVGSFEGHGAALRNPVGEITSTDVPAVFFVRAVTSAALAADERRIVTASADGTVRIWPFFPTTQSLVDHVKAAAVRCLTPSQRKGYRLEPEPPDWCIERQRWPYQGTDWRAWLTSRRQGNPIAMPLTK